MTKKDLKQIFYINKEIKMWQDKLDEMTEIKSTNMSGLSSAHSQGDNTSDMAIQKAEITSAIAELQAKIQVKQCEIMDFIEHIDDSIIRQIIQYRYIDLMTWIEVSMKVYGRPDMNEVARKYHEVYLRKNGIF